MQRTQLNQYCNNEITRLDTAVLARLCTALDCKIEDILEFVPADDNLILTFKSRYWNVLSSNDFFLLERIIQFSFKLQILIVFVWILPYRTFLYRVNNPILDLMAFTPLTDSFTIEASTFDITR